MAPLYLFIALIIQGSLIFANPDEIEDTEQETLRDILKEKPIIDDEVVKDFHMAKEDVFDMFLLPSNNNNIYPTSSAAMMAQATNTNKTAEEQLEDIKEIAQTIKLAIQSEMANFLSYALNTADEEEVKENKLRKRRSVETPMDSTELVMRLLKHIKSNNEYQNIAIDKMMSAQEIADKFGIEFSPDPDVLSDLAVAANEHAKELTTILKDACELKNVTRETIDFVPLNDKEDKQHKLKETPENSTYYIYAVYSPEEEVIAQQNALPDIEFVPQIVPKTHPSVNHFHYSDPYSNNQYSYPYETQIPSPPVQYYNAPVSQKSNFFEPVSFTPVPDYYPQYCSVEPVPKTTNIVLPFEDVAEPEPEFVGEEFEEVISSKVFVERGDEPGSATVNHVTTYTLAEKSHFKTPQIERLPQQMQYTFFLL